MAGKVTNRLAGTVEEWPMVPSVRESDAAEQVLESRIRAQAVHPQVRFNEIDDVRRSFLVGSFEEFEGLVLLAQPRVYGRNHISGGITSFRLAQQIAKYLSGRGPVT